MNTETVDKHLDAVLRASGSALKHYSMQKTLDDMRAAMRAAMADPVRGELVGALGACEMALMGYTHQNDITRSALSKARHALGMVDLKELDGYPVDVDGDKLPFLKAR